MRSTGPGWGHKRLFFTLLIEMAAFATAAVLFLCPLTVPCPPPLLCFCPHPLLALCSFLPSFLSLSHFLWSLPFKSPSFLQVLEYSSSPGCFLPLPSSHTFLTMCFRVLLRSCCYNFPWRGWGGKAKTCEQKEAQLY